jgi:hypothetical protein
MIANCTCGDSDDAWGAARVDIRVIDIETLNSFDRQ